MEQIGRLSNQLLISVERPRTIVLSSAIFVLMIALALIGLIHPPQNPMSMSIMDRFAPPSPAHWMGTDEFGRDIFSRLLAALATDFAVGFGAMIFGWIGGAIIGAVAGYSGRWVGEVLMRLMDAAYAFPHLVLSLLLLTVVGPGELSAVFAIGIFSVPVFARLTYGSVMEGKLLLYVKAAQSLGGHPLYVLRRHVFPHALPTLLVQAASSFSIAILAEAALSFLGIGIQPPAPTLGGMLSDAVNYLAESPWMALFPGLFLLLTVVGATTIGDAIEGRVR
ncbi:MAG: ABC transporter permease [Bacilli bacterium]